MFFQRKDIKMKDMCRQLQARRGYAGGSRFGTLPCPCASEQDEDPDSVVDPLARLALDPTQARRRSSTNLA